MDTGFRRYIQLQRLKLLFALLLLILLFIGVVFLGFNRNFNQVALIALVAMGGDILLGYYFYRKWQFPLSALITSISLSIILDFPHGFKYLFVPPLFAVTSKYVFTFKGKHVFNPSLFAIVMSVFFLSSHMGIAPAFQWNNFRYSGVIIILFYLIFIASKIKRNLLVVSFLFFYTLSLLVRAKWNSYGVENTTLILNTLLSPSFLLFSLFMITDPATSAGERKWQVLTGFLIALIDLIFHFYGSYYTFFYAAFLVTVLRYIYRIARDLKYNKGLGEIEFSFMLKKATIVILVSSVIVFSSNPTNNMQLPLNFELVPSSITQLNLKSGMLEEKVDPRIKHVAKWLLASFGSVAVGDVNNDGLIDLAFVDPNLSPEDRVSIFLNRGSFKFERLALESLTAPNTEKKDGVPSTSIFSDYDNDGDVDLIVLYGSGHPYILKNIFAENGTLGFEKVINSGLEKSYSIPLSASMIDINHDGRLDLIWGGMLSEKLSGYDKPTKLSLFNLPQSEYLNDERFLKFMPESWISAKNGGSKFIYMQKENGTFESLDSLKQGLEGGAFTISSGASDFNNDGLTDLYFANDFGPDELYIQQMNNTFKKVIGKNSNEIGRDSYKSMTVTISDFDKNGFQDIYVSNIHKPLLSEGSMLWMFESNLANVHDGASSYGVVNEDRWGWGASAEDINNDSWPDIVQVNGMFDDEFDQTSKKCKDYWYVADKISRAPDRFDFEIRNAGNWSDVRGSCLTPNEKSRFFLNLGSQGKQEFQSYSEEVGLNQRINGRGVAAVDLDNNGVLDLVVTRWKKSPMIYKTNLLNSKDEKNFWIGVKLVGDGVRCNKDALGSTIRIDDQVKEVEINSGYASQRDPRVHFGLGRFKKMEKELFINWCGVKKETIKIAELNKYYTFRMNQKK